MAKAPKKDGEPKTATQDRRGARRPERLEDVETEPGAWERFERAVDAALHTPPKQRLRRGCGDKKPGAKGKDGAE